MIFSIYFFHVEFITYFNSCIHTVLNNSNSDRNSIAIDHENTFTFFEIFFIPFFLFFNPLISLNSTFEIRPIENRILTNLVELFMIPNSPRIMMTGYSFPEDTF